MNRPETARGEANRHRTIFANRSRRIVAQAVPLPQRLLNAVQALA